MTTWQRLGPLGGVSETQSDETWIYTPGDGNEMHFQVSVTNGKPLDVVSLKGTDLRGIRDYAAYLGGVAAKLYARDAKRRRFEACPCCGSSTEEGVVESYRFIGVPVHRCRMCGHGFVLDQPVEEVLNSVFADSENHSSVYVDRESLEARMREIVSPKVDWSMSVYKGQYGNAPSSGIDVGAGGGHFVEGMKRAGVAAVGFELSSASRRFASEIFGIDLRDENFLNANAEPVSLVTFWGLLEYTPEPRRFLEVARRCLSRADGLLIVEVPRLDCLGTAVQAENPNNIARHMDPTSHVNTFSDASLATVLVETGFRPIAAWYFGMDIYEFLVQAALRLDQAEIVDKLADMIPGLQGSLDRGRLCDDIVVAAVPMD